MGMVQETRTPALPGKKWFNVETTFIRNGTFEVYAENEEQAKQLVKEKCGVYLADIFTDIPLDQVGWDFDSHSDTEIGDVKQIKED
jgi:hypothetical protein